MMHDLKVLRYDSCVTRGSHSFTCHPHTNHLPLLPSRKASPPLGQYQLILLGCEKHAQSFYAACLAETQTHDLSTASPTLYRQRHDTTSLRRSTITGHHPPFPFRHPVPLVEVWVLSPPEKCWDCECLLVSCAVFLGRVEHTVMSCVLKINLQRFSTYK